MIKRLQKSDLFFIAAVLCALTFHLTLIWAPHRLYDETFYATVPYRLIIGDSLVQHEWHLTQFSSLFLYLPVRLWLLIKGSTAGIYLYLRFVYIFAHTSVTVAVYKFFRKYGVWSAVAAIMYYILIPFKTYALNYTSMLVIFYLFFTLSLFCIYKNHSVKSYLATGFCFGCCCVNNPIFCIFFALYLILCALWKKKEILINLISNHYSVSRYTRKNPQKAKRKSFEAIKTATEEKRIFFAQCFENYNCFFSKEAIIYSFAGLCIIAGISVIFFFATGGTISSIFENLENLMSASEYFTTSKGAWIQKSFDFRNAINTMSFGMPYLLPIFFFVILADKKRKANTHRIGYLTGALALAVMVSAGMLSADENTAFFYSLPFAIFSLVCYILTDKRQTDLFFCIWCPSMAAATLSAIASNTLFYSSSAICSISNIVGVFFACNLFREMIADHQNGTTEKSYGKFFARVGQITIIIAICFQVTLSGFFMREFLTLGENDTFKITNGPLKGMYYHEEAYKLYQSNLKLLDHVKEISDENDPIYVGANLNWTYMYADRPFGTYSAYFLGVEPDVLAAYYEKNPDKIPKYICYFSVLDTRYTCSSQEMFEEDKDLLDSMFEYTTEHFENGILLKVTDYIYDSLTYTDPR